MPWRWGASAAGLALVAAVGPAPAAAAPAYDANCRTCHQAAGAGLPGQFPRLAGRGASLARDPAGRLYLIHAVLSGLAGKVMVDGRPIVGVMPAFGRLGDAEVADALNEVSAFDGGAPKPRRFTAAEVQAARKDATTGDALRSARDALIARGVLP